MSNPLDVPATQRLVRLLGMLGSVHDGEVVTAGRMADRFVRERGLTWDQVIGTVHQEPAAFDPAREPPETAEEWRQLARWVMRFSYELSGRERTFVEQMTAWRGKPTEKQQAWMQAIAERFRGQT